MDPQVKCIQPGGGIVMSLELAWGRLRRWLLRRFRPGYVRRMAALRQGTRGGIPFEPVDSRDVKYYRNQATYWWSPADDPFAWRDRLPFVRVGLAELILIGGGFALLTLIAGLFWWPLAIPLAVVTGCVVWFFRDPTRIAPPEVGQVVSPADGRIASIVEVDDPEIGPAIEIGIFLSIFNVHANRSPVAGLVTGIKYRPGKMLNALRPESAKENERLEVMISATERPHRLLRVNQITGQFARRIVCWVRPGDSVDRGEMFGMIKLGSRTELVLPRHEGLEVQTRVGDKVCAGTTVLARYQVPTAADQQNEPEVRGQRPLSNDA
jgi:phosphatidylserine decarboxylase